MTHERVRRRIAVIVAGLFVISQGLAALGLAVYLRDEVIIAWLLAAGAGAAAGTFLCRLLLRRTALAASAVPPLMIGVLCSVGLTIGVQHALLGPLPPDGLNVGLLVALAWGGPLSLALSHLGRTARPKAAPQGV